MAVSVAILGPFPNRDAAASVGGVAVHGAALAEALRARGTQVAVISDSHVHGSSIDGAGIRGASSSDRLRLAATHPLAALGVLARTLASSERRMLGLPLSRSFTRGLLLHLALRDASPDVVHVQQADFRQLYLELAGWSGPVVVTVHGLGALETGEYPALKRIVPAHVLSADALTAPSAALASEIESIGDALHVEVVPNAVDHDLFTPSDAAARAQDVPGSPALLYVGRVTEFKGAGDLLQAFAIVRESLPQATLTVVGPLGEGFEADLYAPGVTVHESVPRQRVPAFMAAADLTIVPSHYEGFGLTALESLACGTPVIATNVGGLPEIVDEHVGALVPPSDPAALARAIVKLVQDGARLESMPAAAIEQASRFSWDDAAAGFEQVYESVR